MKILIVDDSKAMRMIVTRTLRQTNLQVSAIVEATNGQEALQKVESENPDLIICDWNMPEMRGIDLLQTLRQSGNAIRFGFVTSESSPAIRQLAMESGASFFITKPFTAESMETALTVLN